MPPNAGYGPVATLVGAGFTTRHVLLTGEMSNPFDASNVGASYRRGRPYYHQEAVSRIVALTGFETVDLALDIACGTGLSTQALSTVARRVVGIDGAIDMVLNADRDHDAAYVVGSAESLPFASGSFDAMTVSSGIDWLDVPRFFSEAARVLRTGGWCGIYDYVFLGAGDDLPGFDPWLAHSYLKRFPSPHVVQADHYAGSQPGFRRVGGDGFEHVATFGNAELTEYLLSEPNTIVAYSNSRAAQSEVRAWLGRHTEQFLPAGKTYPFKVSVPVRRSGTRMRPAP